MNLEEESVNAFTAIDKLHSHLNGSDDPRIERTDLGSIRIRGADGSLIQVARVGDEMDFYIIETTESAEYGPTARRTSHWVVNSEGKVVSGGSIGTYANREEMFLGSFQVAHPDIEAALTDAHRILETEGLPIT